ncbi:GNAT family N-acetyltransferase [Streptomyces sp. NPDC002889]|uniref:GNAT family N-acetyltransferase n=1 Tax=Streptomyces sp. NPDC002889 TaxID=3364669 RepID=UPI0036B88D6A
MEYVIRPVRAEEWAKARELRLAALQDPLSAIAFLELYEKAVAQPDSFWQRRTADAATGREVVQFIAEAPDGRWDGTLSVLVEHPGDEPKVGKPASVEQTHVVAVFVRSEARGAGVAEKLIRAGLEWSWALAAPPVERVRLIFHADNGRAEALYRRVGFVPSGDPAPVPGNEMALEYEIRRQGVSSPTHRAPGATK